MTEATGASPVTRKAMARLSGSLDLTFRGIGSVEGLQYATGVTELLLTGNAITDIGPLVSLSGLRRLDADRNPIAALPGDMSGLERLTELHLGGTRLTGLPEALTGLPRLRRLYLEDLDIAAPADLTALADTLNRLFLSGSAFPDWSFLAALTKLELLDMRGCGLTELPESVASLTALRYVYLQDNELEELPDWLGGLTRLERLDVTGNRLYALPSSMASLTRLRHLVLSDNEFFSLPGWITGLAGLEVLLASDNHLTRVPDGFSRLGNLYRFSFQNNNLTSIAPVGRIPVGYPYQVSFTYNLLDLSDAATAGLLSYYDKAGARQKTPITARVVAAGTEGVQIEAAFDAAGHDDFLSEDCSVEAPRLYRQDGEGYYRLVAIGEYSAACGVAIVTDRSGLTAGAAYRYQLVVPVVLPDGVRVSYQAAATVSDLAEPTAAPSAQAEPAPTPDPEPAAVGRKLLGAALVALAALAALAAGLRYAAGKRRGGSRKK